MASITLYIRQRKGALIALLLTCLLLACGGGGNNSVDGVNNGGNSGGNNGGGGGNNGGRSSYTVGGTVSGLAPTKTITLRLNNSEQITVTGDGNFQFATELAVGETYRVSPSTVDGQSCSISNSFGTVSANGDVNDISLICSTDIDTAQPVVIRQIDVMQTLSQPANSTYQLLVPNRPATVRAYVNKTGHGTPAAVSLKVNNGSPVAMSCPATLPLDTGSTDTIYTPYDLTISCNVSLTAAQVRRGMTLTVTSGDVIKSVAPAVNSKSVINVVVVPLVIDKQTADSSLAEMAKLKGKLLNILPFSDINLTVRSAYTPSAKATVNLLGAYDWNDVLNEISTLRSTEAPTKFYYGLAPLNCTALKNIRSLTVGMGIIGRGYGPTSAMGFDSALDRCDNWGFSWQTMAHELGHTLSLQHAPCPSGGDAPKGIDPYFTDGNLWPGASTAKLSPAAIGVVVDSLASLLYKADGVWSIIDPTTSGETGVTNLGTDLMAYCGGEWLSEYSYNKIAQYIRDNSAATTTTPVASAQVVSAQTPQIRISGAIDGNGQVRLNPVLAVSGLPPSRLSGDHVLRIVTANGQTRQYAFMPDEVADAPAPLWHFALTVPDAGEIASIAVMKNGRALPLNRPQAPPAAASRQQIYANGAPSAALPPAGTAHLTETNGRVGVEWNATTHPWLTLTHVAANGQRTVLAVQASGGSLSLPLDGVAAGGQWELSLSDGLSARRQVIAR